MMLSRLISASLKHLKDFDLRFPDADEEAAYKASLEPELLSWMMAGLVFSVMLATVLIFDDQLGIGHEDEVLKTSPSLYRSVMVLQLLLWSVVPACFAVVIGLRIGRNFFVSWNLEVVVTFMMVYGAVAVVVGQRFYLTLLLAGSDDVVPYTACTAEAWVLLGLQSITIAATFFLPLRRLVVWFVPFTGLLAYAFVQFFLDTELETNEAMLRFVVMAILAFLAWCGACGVERHMRAEWSALQKVDHQCHTIEQQQMSIQAEGRRVQEQAEQIQATTHLLTSLQTVAKALCDEMVHLNDDLCIIRTESHDLFFENKAVGRPFVHFLNATDQERFAECVSQAAVSHLPVCLPVTLYREWSSNEVNLVVVSSARPDCRYLIGIRVESDSGRANPSQPEAGIIPGTMDQDSTADGGSFNSIVPVHSRQPPSRAISTIDEDAMSDFDSPVGRRLSGSAQTSTKSRGRTLRMVMKRWQLNLDLSRRCCPFHAMVDTVPQVLDFLREERCEPGWTCLKEQCRRCSCMFQGNRCAVCGLIVDSGEGRVPEELA